MVETLARLKPDRDLRTNVEFFAGVVMERCGIPRELFTSTFAVSRTAGWCAHALEQAAARRLIRPSARYTGPAPAVPVPAIEEAVMDHDEGVRLGEGWVADWNRHDLDAVMARLHDDIVFSSPHIPVMVGEPSGVLRGKAAVRAYWARALELLPDLHFDLLGVTVGHDALAVRYVNERGRESTEVLLLDADGLVVRGAGTYGEPPGVPS